MDLWEVPFKTPLSALFILWTSFFLWQRTMILFQRCARQALWPSPYLDAFGEEVIFFYLDMVWIFDCVEAYFLFSLQLIFFVTVLLSASSHHATMRLCKILEGGYYC